MHLKKSSLWPLVVITIVVLTASAIAWRLGYFEADQRDRLIASIGDVRGSWTAAAIFMGCWILAVIFCLPTTVITIVGGALFGTLRGAAFSWSAALLGTAIAHVLAQALSTRGIRRLFGQHRLLETLGETSTVWQLVRLRVMPVAPFGVVDYVAGLARVPVRVLLLATAIGIAPGTLAYAFAGSQLRAGIESPEGTGRTAFLLAGAVTLIMTATALIPWARKRVTAK